MLKASLPRVEHLEWQDAGRSRGLWSSAWDHDYPRAEQHLSQILHELTYLDMHRERSRILRLDDPERDGPRGVRA